MLSGVPIWTKHCVIWNTNLIAFIPCLLHVRPVIQKQLLKPYVWCHLFSWEISAKTCHSWGNKVWQSSSKRNIKSVKLYTAEFILIHWHCLELISLSPLLPFSVCACGPLHECVSIAKNINFTNISPRLMFTKHIQSIMLRFIVLWGVTGCKAVLVIKSDHRVPSQTRTPRSASHTQPSLSSEQLLHILNLSRPAFLHYFPNDL